MKIIDGIVCYPIVCQITIDDTASDEEIEKALLKEAEKIFEVSTIKPVVHDWEEQEPPKHDSNIVENENNIQNILL